MRFLLTGSSGFIGRHLSIELTAHGHEVFGVDVDAPEWSKSLDGFWHGDLLTPGLFQSLLHEWQPNVVVHLAAQVGRERGEDDVIYTVQQNAQMTSQIARAVGEASFAKHDPGLLFTSTSEVYGDRGDETCSEGMEDIGGSYDFSDDVLPHNLYGLSKLWAEQACRLYVPNHRLKVARLSMPYGPGAPPGRGRRAMDNFLWHAQHDRTIEVHRGAERSWCWVGDTAAGLRMICENWAPWEVQTYNIGRDDRPRTMLEVAQMACLMNGADLGLIEEVDPPPMQTVVKRLSTQRLHDIGWQPTIELPEGMEMVNDWVKNYDADGEWIGDD